MVCFLQAFAKSCRIRALVIWRRMSTLWRHVPARTSTRKSFHRALARLLLRRADQSFCVVSSAARAKALSTPAAV